MTRFRQIRFWAIAGTLAASSLRCGGDNIRPPEASAIEMVGGDGQTGPAGQQLANPLVVLITDQAGSPVQGVSVRWAAQAGGSVSAETVVTDADGHASVQRVLGTTPGEQGTTATVTGLTGSPVAFVAVAADGQSPALGMLVQPSSTAQTGVQFAVQPIIQLQEPNGNDRAQSGLAVIAAIANGTGTLGGTLTRETDNNGRATFTDLAISGPAGSYNLRFTASGTNQVLSSAITLTAAAGGIVITTNPPVSALSGEVFDPIAQPVVQVTDATGSPVSGVPVAAITASGTGTLEGTTTATTDAGGTARFGDLGIRGSGANTLKFTAGSASVTSSPVAISALPAEASTGKWGPVVDWGSVVPLHMTLLPTGKILAWGKLENDGVTMAMPRLWDPSSGPPTTAREVPLDTMLFCSGHTLMPDGRVMVSGGHKRDDVGIDRTNIFDPATESWVPGLAKMAFGRWYPTVTVLPTGEMLTMAGHDSAGKSVKIPEIWEDNSHWVKLPGASDVDIPYYPRNYVAPDGRIFMAGERIESRWFDVNGIGVGGGRGKWIDGPMHIYRFNRDYGTSAMYEPGKILYAGGGGHPTWGSSPDPKTNVPTATAEKIDLNQASPQWQSAGSMSAPRRHTNSTILPDGQVLITGGTRGGGFVDINPADAVKEAELWNPATNQWTTLAAASKMRVYHSVSLLLPDGTVLHGASGNAMAAQPNGTIVPVPDERNHEIFSPPYLFKGVRPTITSMPTTVGYGQIFSVVTPNAAQVTTVRWIRLGSVTHAFDAGQRANTLSFTRTANGVDVTAPANPNLAPPGYYQVFILNRNGVPSVSKFVRIQ